MPTCTLDAAATPAYCSDCASAFLAGVLISILASTASSRPPLDRSGSLTTQEPSLGHLTTPEQPRRARSPFATPSTPSTSPSSLGSPVRLDEPHNPHPHPEQQYLDLARNILDRGERRKTPKGVGALALFAPPPLRFALSRLANPLDSSSPLESVVPLLTTKRVDFRAIVEELLWMLKGKTDAHVLRSEIWNGNSSREYLDGRGLVDHVEGDTGPGYGFQWRHAGAAYRGKDDAYEGEGVDQLARLIESIKHEAEKRKHILCAWSAADLDQMALAPCPCLVQFYVHSLPPSSASTSSTSAEPPPRLSCTVYQRSADVALGIPYDIAAYALLAHLVARLTGTVAAELTFMFGDAHVYYDHVDGLRRQLERAPKGDGFPTITLSRSREELEATGGVDGVEESDFELRGYEPAGRISFVLHP
ncbi:hypothetical protein JCM9279_002725 [Rhodotorula babjevae]